MAAGTRPVPPASPAANDTGVVPRWRAWASTAAAGLIGHGIGRYGLADTVGLAALAFVTAIAALGVCLELRSQWRRPTDFDHIDARHQVDRALESRGDRC